MRPELSPQAPPTVLVRPSLLWSLEKLKVNRATWAVIGPIELCESWHSLIGPIELCESWHSSWALMEEAEARTHLQSWVSTGKSRWLGLQGRWWQRLLVMYWVLVLQVRPEIFWVFPHPRREFYLKNRVYPLGLKRGGWSLGSQRFRGVRVFLAVSGNCKTGWNCQDNRFRALKVEQGK